MFGIGNLLSAVIEAVKLPVDIVDTMAGQSGRISERIEKIQEKLEDMEK